MKVRPGKNVLLVRAAYTPHQDGSIFIPESARVKPNHGWVIRAGKGCLCKKGDLVHFLTGAMELLKDETVLIREQHCYLMFDGPFMRISKMKLHDGWVCVKVPYLITTGKAGLIQTPEAVSSDAQNEATVRHGEVAVAPRYAVNRNHNPYGAEMMVASYINRDPEVNVKKGDKVFFTPYIVNSIRSGEYLYKSHIQMGGNEYIIFPYRELVCKWTDDSITGLNDFHVVQKRTVSRMMVWTPKPVEDADYISESTEGILEKGDIVVLDKQNRFAKLESSIANIFDEEFYVFRDYMMALTHRGQLITYNKNIISTSTND